eukprot:4191295-Lingulodinium_polyedra.AAC.1
MSSPPGSTTFEQRSLWMSASRFLMDWKSRRGLRSPPCRPSLAGKVPPGKDLNTICYNIL